MSYPNYKNTTGFYKYCFKISSFPLIKDIANNFLDQLIVATTDDKMEVSGGFTQLISSVCSHDVHRCEKLLYSR